jgi:hypothetical protein
MGLEGSRWIWKHLEEFGRIWKDLDGFGSISRKLDGFGGIWMDSEGFGERCLRRRSHVVKLTKRSSFVFGGYCIVGLEILGKSKIFIRLIGSRTRDLLACSTVPESLRYRLPLN